MENVLCRAEEKFNFFPGAVVWNFAGGSIDKPGMFQSMLSIKALGSPHAAPPVSRVGV